MQVRFVTVTDYAFLLSQDIRYVTRYDVVKRRANYYYLRIGYYSNGEFDYVFETEEARDKAFEIVTKGLLGIYL